MRPYLLLPILVVTFSCTNTSSSSSSSGGTGTSQAQQDFVTQYCSLIAPCCAATNTCTTTFPAPTNYDATAGQACLAALKANSVSDRFCSSQALLVENPACQRLQIRGTTPIGGACNDAVSGFECAQPAGAHVACVFATGAGLLCLNVALGNLGDACSEDSNDDGSLPMGASVDNPVVGTTAVFCNRAAGFHCGGGGKCIARAALGQSCTDTKSCVAGAYCPFADPPTCLARLADNSPCTGDNDACQSGNCVAQVCSTKAEEGVSAVCGG